MRIMLSDNRDSFTYNIVHLLKKIGLEVDVYDNFTPVDEIDTSLYDGLIVSPGPGNPLLESDRGNGYELLENKGFPAVMGVCFGHQLIGSFLGCDIYRTEKLYHGEIDIMEATGGGLMKGLPEEFQAVRYHSLAVTPNKAIIVDAVSKTDGSLMAYHSRDGRYYGIQFHPESHYSQYGEMILSNFIGAIIERSGRDIQQELQ